MPSRDTVSAADVISLSAPVFQGREWEYLKACLDSGWVYSGGPFVERFEREVATYVGAAHGIAVVNGTAGLHIALQVVGVQPGDEVVVSDLTFIAPVNAITYCGAHPILVDADPATWQMDVEQLERFLVEESEVRGAACYNRRTGRRLRAIVPVHILGLACAMDRVLALAQRYHLKVVEDAAEGMGVRYQGQHLGTFGDVGVLSFNGNKVMTSGGGGMVITNQADAAENSRYLTTQAKDDRVESIHHAVGYNYRLSNLQAAVGVAQLAQLDEFLVRKRAIARVYEEAFRGWPGLTTMPDLPHTEATSWLYTVLLPEVVTLEHRRALVRRLRDHGIETRPLWHPIHGLAPYRACQRVGGEQAERLHRRSLCLPSGVGLTEAELMRCVAAVKERLETA